MPLEDDMNEESGNVVLVLSGAARSAAESK
jgi:hypothetical protein